MTATHTESQVNFKRPNWKFDIKFQSGWYILPLVIIGLVFWTIVVPFYIL